MSTLAVEQQEVTALAKKKASFIVATNILDAQRLPHEQGISTCKEQGGVERGFRFLKDPLFLASSVFLKKPERVIALPLRDGALLVGVSAGRTFAASPTGGNGTNHSQKGSTNRPIAPRCAGFSNVLRALISCTFAVVPASNPRFWGCKRFIGRFFVYLVLRIRTSIFSPRKLRIVGNMLSFMISLCKHIAKITTTSGDRYITTPYEKGTKKSFGAQGRVIAAALLYHLGVSDCLLLSTGKTDPEDQGAPSEASVMKAELLAYGVPETCMHLEENSKTTEENARELVKLFTTEKFKEKRTIGVITSSWHIKRTAAFLNREGVHAESRKIKYVSSDTMIRRYLPEFRDDIHLIYQRQEMKDRIQDERNGYNALKKAPINPVNQVRPGHR